MKAEAPVPCYEDTLFNEPERLVAGERCHTDRLRPGPDGRIGAGPAKLWKMGEGVYGCCGSRPMIVSQNARW